MASKSTHSRLAGSERLPLPGAIATGPVRDDERFEVTVRLRRKQALDSKHATHADASPRLRRYLTHDEYADQYGADPRDIAKVEKFAREHELVMVDSSVDRRSVFLSGTAGAFAMAFGTKIEYFEHPNGSYRGRTGALSIPNELQGIIEGVFGIDDRPIAKPHFQRRQSAAGLQPHAAANSYTPLQLAELYNFPQGLDGSGQCIGIIELGGGYRSTDLKAYFKQLGLPTPKVHAVRVDGARNMPSTADSADGEVMLDIEVAAAIAPKAQIAVYFAPNTDKGFLDAITKVIHDKVNKPSVISISWGAAEANWTQQAMASYDQAFQAAAALGVTICCAAGDNGSGDGVADHRAHVDFPASSPHVLGCGGTRLIASNNMISSETVWNDGPQSATGGGVSDMFGVPAYQRSAQVPLSANGGGKTGRGVPDVAGDADPNTGYVVRVDGEEFVIGGTSAVAPLWAGLIALMNQKLGKPIGFLNPLLYGSLSGNGCFQDITIGNNGAYMSQPGWDVCTGWGSPKGTQLLQALSA